MITTVMFDADGVLVNGEGFATILARDFPGIDRAKEKEFFTTHFQDCLVGKANLKQSVAPYLHSFGWPGTVDEFLDYWFKAEHQLNEDLIAYVQQLRARGLHVVLATNQEQYRTEYMLRHMGFAEAFEKVYSSAHLGHKKPAQEFFAKVIDDMGAVKDEVLFWDDDPENIAGAQAYGIHAEHYTTYPAFLTTMRTKYQL